MNIRPWTLLIALLALIALGGTACGGDDNATGEVAESDAEFIDVDGLNTQRDAEADLQVIDVRTPEEWAEGTIEGAILRPHDAIVDGEIQEIDLDRPIAVICRSGNRATTAGNALVEAGATDVRVVRPGGVGTWADAGYPTVTP